MTNHIRNFQIEGTEFTLNGKDGRMYLQSHHPYDNTEYHWAVRDPQDGSWKVYRAGRYQITLGSAMTQLDPETVAHKLLALDRAAGLKPHTAIW